MKKIGSSARLSARKVALIIATVFVVLSLISVFSINLIDRASNEAALYKANYSIDKNGVYTISPKKGYDGFSSITLNVDVAGASVSASYTVSSVDELPTNAVEGSMAIVPSDSLIGKWEWKDSTSPLDLSMFNGKPTGLDEILNIYGSDDIAGIIFNGLYFGMEDDMFKILFLDGSIERTLLASDGVFDDSFSSFELYSDPICGDNNFITADMFKTFIKTNCNRLSGGYSLYTHENGEWVYKCEMQ